MLTKIDLENNLQRVHEWIKGADEKVSIFLAFQGVALTILFPKAFSWIKENFWEFVPLEFLVLVTGVILVAFSLYKSIHAIIPKMNKEKHKKSITFFGDIGQFELEEFRKEVKKIDDEEYVDELINQIYISSEIATQKHIQFREAILVFFGGFVLLVIIFLIVGM